LHVDQREVSPYGALGLYTGDGWAWTTGPNSSTATVTMSATLWDKNLAEGDLRAAKVTFYFVDSSGRLSPISSAKNLPVGLVDITDGTIGTASAIVQLNIGNNFAQSFKIAVGVTGAYTNDPKSLISQEIVTVSKPVTGGQMVGGGKLSNSSSSGLIKAPNTSKTLWDFNITYTKSGTNPKGKVEFTFNSYYKPDGTLDSVMKPDGTLENVLHTYTVKSNAIASLAVSPPNSGKPGTAVFSSKANVTDITNPSAPVGVDSGTVLQITVTDGTPDTLGISLQRKAGGLWYSSSWTAGKTVELNAGGNISIGK